RLVLTVALARERRVPDPAVGLAQHPEILLAIRGRGAGATCGEEHDTQGDPHRAHRHDGAMLGAPFAACQGAWAGVSLANRQHGPRECATRRMLEAMRAVRQGAVCSARRCAWPSGTGEPACA